MHKPNSKALLNISKKLTFSKKFIFTANFINFTVFQSETSDHSKAYTLSNLSTIYFKIDSLYPFSSSLVSLECFVITIKN